MALRTTAHGGAAAGGSAFSTDTGMMHSGAQYVRSMRDTMVGRVNGLIADLEAELNPSTFRGEAQAAYASAKERWHGVHVNLMTTMENIATAMQSSGSSYQTMDQDNSQGIRKTAQDL